MGREHNPYAAPNHQDAAPQIRTTYPSRARAILGEAWRGAKFGGKLMAFIVTPLMLLLSIVWIAAFAHLAWSYPGQFWYVVDHLKPHWVLLGGLGIFAMTALLGAAAGAVLMGLAAGIQYRRPPTDAQLE